MDDTLIFKSYQRLLLRDLENIKAALNSKNYETAGKIIDNLITDTQKGIEDAD